MVGEHNPFYKHNQLHAEELELDQLCINTYVYICEYI